MKEDRLNGLALLMVHRSISISIKEINDVFASTQQRRMKLAFILDDATENGDENNICILILWTFN